MVANSRWNLIPRLKVKG